MGLIEKQVRKRGNEQLAAPVSATTRLTISEAVAAIRKICDEHNQRVEQYFAAKKPSRWTAQKNPKASYLHLGVTETEVLVSWAQTPGWIRSQDKKRRAANERWWLAVVTFPKSNAPNGKIVVQLKLERWLTDSNHGKIQGQDKFEWFSEELAKAIR